MLKVTSAFLLTACIVLSSSTARAQDAAGVWKGKWTSNPTARRGEHGGALRVRLTPTGPCSYDGTFSGRFALIIPYFYRAPVYQHGNTLTSTKKLGPMGEYSMTLQHQGAVMNGGWNAGKHRGKIQLRKR